MHQQNEDALTALVKEVTKSKKYAQITPSLVYKISSEELGRHKDIPKTIKAVRTRLHQIIGAYLTPKNNYAQQIQLLTRNDLISLNEYKRIAVQMMKLHASTAERIPYLNVFYETCLEPISPVVSVLDLACGLNPLAIPWMPLALNFHYDACDVVLSVLNLLKQVFLSQHYQGDIFECDLSNSIPTKPAQVAFLLKTIPLLDQIDKSLAGKVLSSINANHILVTYPLFSLGGKKKGMGTNYAQSFDQLIEGMPFSVQKFVFPNELAYLISRD